MIRGVLKRETRQSLIRVAVLLFLVCCTSEKKNSWMDPPEMAPEFSLESLSDTSVAMDDLLGNTVIIDFWATWCAPCVKQVPVLNKFMDDNRGKGVEVIGISVDSKGWNVIRPFVQKHQIRYTVLLGDESLAQSYGALGFPATFVVAPSGKISHVHFGVISLSELSNAVEKANKGF